MRRLDSTADVTPTKGGLRCHPANSGNARACSVAVGISCALRDERVRDLASLSELAGGHTRCRLGIRADECPTSGRGAARGVGCSSEAEPADSNADSIPARGEVQPGYIRK